MDSSRSGLLSTLLMTVPLIVVPAIALLRPPGQLNGVSTSSLDAAESKEEDDFLSNTLDELSRDLEKSEDNPDSRNRPEDIEQVPGEEFSESPELRTRPERDAAPGRSKSKPNSADPFVPPMNEDILEADSGTTSGDPESDFGVSAEEIVEQLNAQGALRTMWFEAGTGSPVGFAAFFRGQTEFMRFRFEAVGQTRDECARNVLNQVMHWQAEQDAGRQN